MKHLFLISVSAFLPLALQAQTLFDIYTALPREAALGDGETRELMVENYNGADKNIDGIYYRFDVVDEKNGYLSVTGAFEGTYEMCYWNIGNKKLVAVYQQGSGGISYIENFDFYLFENGKFREQKIEDIIPGYETIYEDFFVNYSVDLLEQLRADDETTTLLFKLPRKGKDILALFGNEGGDYRKFAKGDRMILKWDNGKFVKGKIYWDEPK